MSKLFSKMSSFNLKTKKRPETKLDKHTNEENEIVMNDLYLTYNKQLRSTDKKFKRDFVTKIDMSVNFLAIGEIGELIIVLTL